MEQHVGDLGFSFFLNTCFMQLNDYTQSTDDREGYERVFMCVTHAESGQINPELYR